VSRRHIVAAIAALVLATGVGFLIGVAAAQTESPAPTTERGLPPPPGWAPDDWATVPPAKREQLAASFARGRSNFLDPIAKLVAILENPNPGPDPADVAAQEAEERANPEGDRVPVGLLRHCQITQILCLSHWQGFRAGEFVQVYAGAIKNAADSDRSTRGVLVVLLWKASVIREDERGRPRSVESYRAPKGLGPLEITGVRGRVVRFVGSSGATGIFDLESRAYRIDHGTP
jgi:hypothetical protein